MKRAAPVLALGMLAASGAPAPDSVFYHRDIAPVLRRHCGDCHHAGGAGPFPLLSYRDAAKRSRFLLDVTESGLMPPWKADPEYRSFANERILPAAELDLLRRWVAAGAPEGPPAAPPASPPVPAEPPPDLVLRMSQPFPVPAGNRSTYICVKLPYEIARDTFVRATDFVPGNRRLAHHASYQILEVAEGVDTRAGPEILVYADSAGGAPDDDSQYRALRLNAPDGTPPRLVFHTGWLPGTSPQKYPPGMGFRLPRRGVLLIRSLHYSPTPVPAFDRSEVRLWFARGPVERKVEFAAFKPEAALVPRREPLRIPANQTARFEIDNVVPLDVSVLAINPHMHRLGRSFLAYAVLPSGDTVPLVRVPDWDFEWQEFYRFRNPVRLPRGSRLRAEAWYDNTRRNPFNPFDPPRDVFFERGMEDTDEMMRLVVLYVPWRPGDEEIVQEP